ncbi:hypothetical protein [Psychrobacter urativorans]|uniref:hypothetical protein n=1 Tax=Psychrobacter urativorans TaxID=45610 RepID=UPI001918E2BE|nr:hypothetical protein [Psychrobacter urativorans]
MQKRTLPLSLLIGAALTIPSLAMAAPANNNNITPVDMPTATAENTLETEESTDSELRSTQPGSFEISETQTISGARINNDNNKEGLATEIETMQAPKEAVQTPEETLGDPQEAVQQAPQEAVQTPRTATQPQSLAR